MGNFSISINDSAVLTAMDALIKRVNNAQPILQAVGDDIVERSKERFATSTGPDGQPWAPNAASTITAYANALVGSRNKLGQRSYRFSKQGGTLNGRGLTKVGGKKPLIGESRDLSRQIFAKASSDSVTIGVSPVYAAIQQFGGKKSQFPKLWGDIPARPFLPVKADGTIYPTEQGLIIDQLNKYLTQDL